MTDAVLLGISNNKFIKETSSKAMSLFCPNGFLNAGYESLHDQTDSNYLIPIGKKFVILNVTIVGASNATGQVNTFMGYSTTVDSATGLTKVSHWQSITTFPYSYETYIEIPAGNYITCFGGSNSANIMVFGVEIDA